VSEVTRHTEQVLLLKVHDEQAWDVLMQTHQQAVFRLAYLFLGDAHDVAQETFIRALHAINSFDATYPLRPWLLSIAANLARNRLRAWGRFAAALRRWVQGQPELVEPRSIEQHGEQHMQSQLLWQAVRVLPPVAQEVIYLRYFLALTEAEAAQTLNVPIGTVKSRTNRAMARLREVIRRDFPDLGEQEAF
jgi:RNA polymerase sigma factor (sigma-70 family)